MKNEKLNIPLSFLTYSGLVVVIMVIVLGSCANNPDQNTETKDSTDLSNIKDSFPKDMEIYYTLPTPDEVLDYIRSENFTFQPGLLSPLTNYNLFLDSRSQAMNLGIYATDLVYMSSFDNQRGVSDYFKVIRSLSDKIRISQVFDLPLVQRIERNLTNVDSLVSISNHSYVKIIDYLLENDRENTMLMLTSGAYIECLYLSINMVKTFSPENLIVQRISDQKVIFESLVSYISSNKDDATLKQTLAEVYEINNIFNEMQTVEVQKTTLKADTSGKLVLDGEVNVAITKEQFEKLKAKVIEVRSKITMNK
jgi:hypothetical protein